MHYVHKRDEEINRILENLKRSCTTELKLQPNFLSLLEPNQRQKGTRGRGGGGGGGRAGGGSDKVREPKRKKLDDEGRDAKKPSPDAWSAPDSVANPVSTFFSNKGDGKVNKER